MVKVENCVGVGSEIDSVVEPGSGVGSEIDSGAEPGSGVDLGVVVEDSLYSIDFSILLPSDVTCIG